MTILALAGTLISAAGSIQEGNMSAAAENANANLADLYASQVRQSGAYEESKLKREKEKMLSTQRAKYAKSGVLITEGSPIEVMADTATQYEKDILANRYNTDIEASRYTYEAQYRRQMAKRYKALGYTNAATTILLNTAAMTGVSGLSGAGKTVTPGQGGYGINTPAGVRNMGNYSLLPK